MNMLVGVLRSEARSLFLSSVLSPFRARNPRVSHRAAATLSFTVTPAESLFYYNKKFPRERGSPV